MPGTSRSDEPAPGRRTAPGDDHRRYQRLRSRLARRFDIVETPVQAGRGTFVIRHPRTSEDLIDEQAFVRDERLPYWADVWPSACILADHVSRHRGDQRKAVEIGCGAGLVGCALARAGYQVTLSDYYHEALDFARLNVWCNTRVRADTLLLDWRDPPKTLSTFDVVAAADVLYERQYGPLVARLITRLLAPGGYAIVADPGRVGFEPFIAEISRLGLKIEEGWDVEFPWSGDRHVIRMRVLVRRGG